MLLAASACSSGEGRGPVRALLGVDGDAGAGAARAMAFVRMPCFRYITARDFVSPATPCFEASLRGSAAGAAQGRLGGGADDRAPADGRHVRQHRPGEQERRGEVDPDDPLPLRVADDEAEPAFARALAERAGPPADDPRAAIQAAMCNAALRAAVEPYAWRDAGRGAQGDELEATVRSALAVVAEGLR